VRWERCIQLGIGPESADTLKPHPVTLQRSCLHLREISQPQVIQYGCTHRTPATCGPSITLRVQPAVHRSQAISGSVPYVLPVVRLRADIAMFSAITPVDSLLYSASNQFPPCGPHLRPV
jgi:hypothetical protein